MTQDVKFYMQKEGEDKISLEDYFPGLLYSKCDGLLDIGKRLNVYKESYHDSDELRVWQGDPPTREATKITFTFCFVGENKLATYHDFYEYVANGKIYYYDTQRMKEALLVLDAAIKPSDEMWYGSIPYIKASFEFQNLWGACKDKTIE